ncbi:VWA domain-containing protein [Verrucomicrobiota bacterium]
MNFITFKPLIWLVILLPLLMFFFKSLVERRRVLKTASFILRCTGIILLILAVCSPVLSLMNDAVHVICLLDISESVDLKDAHQTFEIIGNKIDNIRKRDSYSTIVFADGIRQMDKDKIQQQLGQWTNGVSDDVFRKQTQISSSLLGARLHFPFGKAKRIILLSDGRNTGGEMTKAIHTLKRENVDVQVHNLKGIQKPEASVISLEPNSHSAYQGERVRLTALFSANRDMNGTARFLHRGIVEKEIPVELKKDADNRVVCEVIMNTAGSAVWSVELVPEYDHFLVNNHASCTIEVKGKARILAIHSKPRELRLFAKAIREQGIDIDVRGEHGLPETIGGLLQFDAIILANVPATSLTTSQMLNIKRYVSDYGGGLLMLGSENSFGLGGYFKTSVEEVLPLVSRYEKEKEKPSLAMVLVIDKSGSMSGMPIALAKEAAKSAVELLSPRDMIGVVAFDGSPYVISEIVSASGANAVCAAIDTLSAGGGTSMYPAMARGQEMLFTASAKIKHMIALSDGQSQPGDFEGLAAEMASEGSTISTIALGAGADRALMHRIAELGRGRYYETVNADTIPRIFTKETIEASRSAIKEEPFSPIPAGGEDFLEGIELDNAPYLLGYVMTRMKPTAKIALLTEAGDPLLATGRYGLGKSAAFTSDVSEKWAGEWVAWRNFGKFWAQILRSTIRKEDAQGIRLVRENSGRLTRIRVYCRDEQGIPKPQIKWSAKLLDETGKHITVPVDETGYGLYETHIAKPTGKSHTLSFYDEENDKLKILHTHKNYPEEYRLNAKQDNEFSQLPVLDKTKKLYDDMIPAKSSRMARNHTIILAMLCLIGSILLRRI